MSTLIERNAEFARSRFKPGLALLPSTRTIVISCVDPRVDPAHCGITRLQDPPEPLARYLDVPASELPSLQVGNPSAAVAIDLDRVRRTPLAKGFRITGGVYDVETGLIEIVPENRG